MFDGDLVMMIAGYNAGHNRVLKSGGKIPNIAETRDYVRKVITHTTVSRRVPLGAGEDRHQDGAGT